MEKKSWGLGVETCGLARENLSSTRSIRLIARLDIKGPNLIKGINLEGLRIIGDPSLFAKQYYKDGADELIYIDCVASLYGRNNLTEVIRDTAREIFIPITVGGGIRSVDDALRILRSGADKVAINTAACRNPSLIRQVSESFGFIEQLQHNYFLDLTKD